MAPPVFAPLPPCDRCDAGGRPTLEVVRTDTLGQRWCICACCAQLVLVASDGRILRH